MTKLSPGVKADFFCSPYDTFSVRRAGAGPWHLLDYPFPIRRQAFLFPCLM
jgi:hypothetical protein